MFPSTRLALQAHGSEVDFLDVNRRYAVDQFYRVTMDIFRERIQIMFGYTPTEIQAVLESVARRESGDFLLNSWIEIFGEEFKPGSIDFSQNERTEKLPVEPDLYLYIYGNVSHRIQVTREGIDRVKSKAVQFLERSGVTDDQFLSMKNSLIEYILIQAIENQIPVPEDLNNLDRDMVRSRYRGRINRACSKLHTLLYPEIPYGESVGVRFTRWIMDRVRRISG